MLTLQDAAGVLRHFRLPEPAAVSVLPGGLSHEMHLVTAGDGTAYTVKRLVAHTHRPDFPAELARAWAIERRMQAAAVPMPRPVADPLTGRGHAHIVGLGMFRVHEYVPGQPLGPDAARHPDVVERAGRLLATVHGAAAAAGPQCPDLAGFAWREVAGQLLAVDGERGAAVARVLPDVEALTRELTSARLVARPTLGTHRDVDPKNVVRRPGGGLVLVDWDVAADADPHHELTTAALDWGGAVDRRFDPSLGDRFLAGYRSRGGPAHPVGDGVSIWLLQYLRWFEYGIRQLARSTHSASGEAVSPSAGRLPGAVAGEVVDWGCRWAGPTRADLPALRAWVDDA